MFIGVCAAPFACSSSPGPIKDIPDDGGGAVGDGDAPNPPETLIRIDTGQLQGEVDGATRRFRGIPFAAPPLGDLRWKPPQPVPAWDGVRPATSYGGRCPQNGGLLGPSSMEEDCLYLNVWTPEPAQNRKLPVMIWLHPGGNTTGSASDEIPLGIGGYIYDGRHIAENQQIVVVTINYRLGVLGFFSHPALDAEDPRGVSGNQGLLDQRMAFDWVRRNIGAFGGDPDNVTVFGASAGSFDVGYHMTSAGSRGLFHRGISQSGGSTKFVRSRSTAEAEVPKFAAALGCVDASRELECLRSQPVSALLMNIPAPDDGGDPKAPGGTPFQGGKLRWEFTVTIDGDVLRAQPRDVVTSGDFAKVPYILGSNTDEGTIFQVGEPAVKTEAEYLAALQRRFGDDGTNVAARYPVSDFPSPQEALMRVNGDFGIVCAIRDSARRFAAAGAPVHVYNFDRPIPISQLAGLNLRATHGAEIAYIFGTAPSDLPKDDVDVGLMMQGYWARHAITGEPNGAGAPNWPALLPDVDVRLNFNLNASVITDFRREYCDFWQVRYDREFQ
jgi:para-nitrobenzyl esterase